MRLRFSLFATNADWSLSVYHAEFPVRNAIVEIPDNDLDAIREARLKGFVEITDEAETTTAVLDSEQPDAGDTASETAPDTADDEPQETEEDPAETPAPASRSRRSSSRKKTAAQPAEED